jgi:hypothetical protein
MGPVTITGTPTAATVNVYGVTSAVTASLSGATINNYSVSQATINAQADQALTDYGASTVEPDPAGTGAAIVSAIGAVLGTPTDTDLATDIANVQTAVAAIEGGAGGTFAQTVTVTTGTPAVAVQGATVEIREADGTLVDIQPTNASGVAVPTCDAGTYSLVVSKSSLYASSTTSITVTAAAARAVTLSAISFTASTRPGTVTVRWTVIDDSDYLPCGAGEGTMQIRMKTAPTTDGFAWGKDARTATTDAQGVVQFPDVPQGCTLLAKLGASTSAGEWFEVSVPADATSPYDAGEILGSVP